MAETYCGKTCTDCTYRENVSCPGCRVGPGRAFGGDCELARCCREKGHEGCDTCSYKGNCGRIFQRDTMAEYRIKKQEREQQALLVRKKKAAFLAPWVSRLFWLFIFANVASLITIEQLVALVPALKLPGQLLNMAVNVGYFLILLKMAPEEPRFKTAAWCMLATAAVNFLFLVVLGKDKLPLLISLPLLPVALVGEYNGFYGFGDALSGMEPQLSDKWYKLWKWYIGCYGALLGCILLAYIVPILAVILVLAAIIGLAVIGIIQIVYVYRTAKALDSYAE